MLAGRFEYAMPPKDIARLFEKRSSSSRNERHISERSLPTALSIDVLRRVDGRSCARLKQASWRSAHCKPFPIHRDRHGKALGARDARTNSECTSNRKRSRKAAPLVAADARAPAPNS
ncbi:hypothetical protein EVAR_59508_1 [Eumeta japonica]|uniref:Uncharacterized protein n=1 Tax=Eumeta variegata TaxID=151549 RepID=A0A4C1XSE3_EUMVA|nr:hypothetical protein EVAR_59508_1 [Eumeta japonica]